VKGSGKSVIAREFSRAVGYKKLRVFPLYQELTSRDLLQRRITDDLGNTTWTDSPLIRSAREGSLCVLDGIHSLDVHALGSLRRLIQDGVVDLPNGERLNMLSPEEVAQGLTGDKHTTACTTDVV
jgi:von Willebrand factor A domain-containing protein 8